MYEGSLDKGRLFCKHVTHSHSSKGSIRSCNHSNWRGGLISSFFLSAVWWTDAVFCCISFHDCCCISWIEILTCCSAKTFTSYSPFHLLPWEHSASWSPMSVLWPEVKLLYLRTSLKSYSSERKVGFNNKTTRMTTDGSGNCPWMRKMGYLLPVWFFTEAQIMEIAVTFFIKTWGVKRVINNQAS